jgi:hypothetical protein
MWMGSMLTLRIKIRRYFLHFSYRTGIALLVLQHTENYTDTKQTFYNKFYFTLFDVGMY